MPKQLSFVIDDETVKLLEQLKEDLNAATTASVLRKALALTQLAVNQVKDEHGNLKDPMATITLRSQRDPAGTQETNIAMRA
jgi:hypothetical protein